MASLESSIPSVVFLCIALEYQIQPFSVLIRCLLERSKVRNWHSEVRIPSISCFQRSSEILVRFATPESAATHKLLKVSSRRFRPSQNACSKAC